MKLAISPQGWRLIAAAVPILLMALAFLGGIAAGQHRQWQKDTKSGCVVVIRATSPQYVFVTSGGSLPVTIKKGSE